MRGPAPPAPPALPTQSPPQGRPTSSPARKFAAEQQHPEQWDLRGLKARLVDQFGFDLDQAGIDPLAITRHELGEAIYEKLKTNYEGKEAILGMDAMRYHERMVMLSVLDGLWKDHLLAMDHLKEGIGLRGYAQQDPLVAYKKESFEMFEAMMTRFQEDTARYLFRMQIVGPDGQPVTAVPEVRHEVPAAPPVASASVSPSREILIPTRAPSTTIDALEREFERKKERELQAARMAGSSNAATAVQQRVVGAKVGRNDPCPCGSGKKYKKCHGVEG